MPRYTPPEVLCLLTALATWPLYFVGGLYFAGPMLAAAFMAVLLFGSSIKLNELHAILWAWVGGMAGLLISLLVGHINFDLSTGEIAKSLAGFIKGWALILIFIAAGALLPLRSSVIIRGQMFVALGTLMLLPLFLMAPIINLPAHLFTSPLQALGGAGPEYFSVDLFSPAPGLSFPRWAFYAPWAPFAGLLGAMLALLSLYETDRFWKLCGACAALAMIVLSQSRMAIVALVICTSFCLVVPYVNKSRFWTAIAMVMALGSVTVPFAFEKVQELLADFDGMRAESSRVRATLQDIAWQRWWDEAYWFGHGTVQSGPHIVAFMPIGSHHTWYGLLFVKGLIGFLAFAIPFIAHGSYAVSRAIKGQTSTLPAGLFLLMLILSFGENIEAEAYLFWPAWLIIGQSLRPGKIVTDQAKA